MKSKRGRWAVLWALGGGAAAVLLSGGAVRRYYDRRVELSRLEDRREEALRRVALVQARRERADKDEMYVELSARRELGLVAPDEIEFRFVESTRTLAGPDKSF